MYVYKVCILMYMYCHSFPFSEIFTYLLILKSHAGAYTCQSNVYKNAECHAEIVFQDQKKYLVIPVEMPCVTYLTLFDTTMTSRHP